MESKAKLAGHALHPMLIVFPLGLLATSIIFDFIYLANGSGRIADAAFWMIAAGVIGGLLAAVPGTIDWAAIAPNTRAKAIGLWHAVGNVIVLVCFAISWVLRNNGDTTAPGNAAITLSVLGGLIAVVTGWLGGELVERLGIGVQPGAHANAPNSMGGRPASDVDTNYTEQGVIGTPPSTVQAATHSGATTYTTPPGRAAAGRAPDPTERREGAPRPTTTDADRGSTPPI
jgi:uncharacterized membrane protein